MPVAAHDPTKPVYLRIGPWSAGETNSGIKVYTLNAQGEPLPGQGALKTVLKDAAPKLLVQGVMSGQQRLTDPVVVGIWQPR